MAQHPHRIYTFDLLRGIAVLTMILAHSVYFFHSRDNEYLVGIEGFGNTVSFVTFLLVSGAVASIVYFGARHTETSIKRGRIFSRAVWLLIAYYVLAFVLLSPELINHEGFAGLRSVLDVLSFRNLPGFTEYFPPFVFYSLLLACFPRFFLWSSRALSHLALVSLAALLAGFTFYAVPANDLLRPWVALLAGAEGLYRFPLLQYLPVFLLGMYWGGSTLRSEGLNTKRALASHLFWFCALIVVVAYIASLFLKVPLAEMFQRWPPSIPFLALGLAFAFFAALILYATKQLRHLRLLRDILLTFGQNALGLFWSHIFLLGLYAAASGPKVSSPLLYLGLFLLLLLLSLALTTFIPFNYRLALTFVRKSHEEHEEALAKESVFHLGKDIAADATAATRGIRNFFFPDPASTSRRVLRKRHTLSLSLIVLAAAAAFFPPTIQELTLQRQQRNAEVWWSDIYAYRQQLTLRNTEAFITIDPGTSVAMTFDHKTLVEQGKSRADGLDVKLVYWTGTEHLIAESIVENPASGESRLVFRAPVAIEAGKREEFYSLYYGGFIVPQPKDGLGDAAAKVSATALAEEPFPLVASVSKSWNLIGVSEDTVAFTVTSAAAFELSQVTYNIDGTEIAGSMIRSSDHTWEALIPVRTLKPGVYKIQATLVDGTTTLTSQQTGFYRSHPLYAAWTIDWEGYDSSQSYLDAIEAIATQYKLPLTHFFNPRVYITDTIAPSRAQYLGNWVKRRLDMGDGLGLHLHLFADFVAYAGVDERTEPNWGDRGDGYGVPLSAFTEDEQVQLIRTALTLMQANRFRDIDIFRAGGWFANIDTIRALERLGFRADSSARTLYRFGRNRLPGHWNIPATAKPFYPSRTNQNISTGTNDFTVLEIPDNGADSYAFSAADMIERFTQNLQHGILSETQQVTFLSHPHWFDTEEQARIRDLFAYVNRYSFLNDQGPVVFTTTNEIATIWEHAQ